ncbi:MAG: nucleoside hydrolase [Erysipelotrichaceae bacterium]|nr:nucleoside hydrolase [Erysipelotrichaceae bacterium]
MKIFLSLENTAENRELSSLLKSLEQFEITDHFDNENKTTVIVNGPLTQLSEMLLKDHTLADRIAEILLVGGSDSYGDVTPVAEKNIYADPESAQHVFLSGIPIVMFGLNITRNLEQKALVPLAYMLEPSVFCTEECGVLVETRGHITRGMTVTDLYSDKQFDYHYVKIVTSIDLPAYQLLVKTLNH